VELAGARLVELAQVRPDASPSGCIVFTTAPPTLPPGGEGFRPITAAEVERTLPGLVRALAERGLEIRLTFSPQWLTPGSPWPPASMANARESLLTAVRSGPRTVAFVGTATAEEWPVWRGFAEAGADEFAAVPLPTDDGETRAYRVVSSTPPPAACRQRPRLVGADEGAVALGYWLREFSPAAVQVSEGWSRLALEGVS
jgi:hypothetical protein